MNLNPSTPAATAFGPLAMSTFGNTNLTLVSHKPVSSPPDLNNIPTTFSNATPTEWGHQTNKSIMYHYSAKAKDLNQYGPGAILFMFRNPATFGLDCPDRSKRVADIFEINELFREWHKNGKHQRVNGPLSSCENVMNEMSFLGVLKSSITGSTRERSLGTAIMNSVVGERASTVNLWGNAAREGVPLHLILKKDAIGAWKFVPYAGHGPPAAEVTYKDSNNEIKMSESFFVGTAISSPTISVDGEQNILDDPVRSNRLQGWTGGVDICVGV